MSEFAGEYGVHPTMINQWKRLLPEGAAGIFERGGKAPAAAEVAEGTVRDLHARIGDRSPWRHWSEPMAETVANDSLS